jgi:uncharacterized glyoxalase superfamily protein PhnB
MTITPYLYYRDVDAAMKFLSKAFGFRKYGTEMRGPDGKTSHAAIQFGNSMVMLGRPPMKYRNPKQLGQTTQSLYINVENVDKHFQRAKKAGATIIQEIENTEYGHRRFLAADLEGHEWAFAQELSVRKSNPKKKKKKEP